MCTYLLKKNLIGNFLVITRSSRNISRTNSYGICKYGIYVSQLLFSMTCIKIIPVDSNSHGTIHDNLKIIILNVFAS